jgi:hypothetical protein
LHGDRHALGRAGAIVAGTVVTAVTYARARLSLTLGLGERYVS